MEDDPIVFATKEDLISAVEEYASSQGFQVVRQRNEEDRITFCCSRGKQRRSKVSRDSTSEDPFNRKRRKSIKIDCPFVMTGNRQRLGDKMGRWDSGFWKLSLTNPIHNHQVFRPSLNNDNDQVDQRQGSEFLIGNDSRSSSFQPIQDAKFEYIPKAISLLQPIPQPPTTIPAPMFQVIHTSDTDENYYCYYNPSQQSLPLINNNGSQQIIFIPSDTVDLSSSVNHRNPSSISIPSLHSAVNLPSNVYHRDPYSISIPSPNLPSNVHQHDTHLAAYHTPPFYLIQRHPPSQFMTHLGSGYPQGSNVPIQNDEESGYESRCVLGENSKEPAMKVQKPKPLKFKAFKME